MKFSVTAAAVSALAIESASASQFDWSSPSIRALNSRGGCCATLMKAPGLKGKVFGKNSTQYQARLETYYSANAALEPWCMVLPTATEDVSQIAKVISQKECPFGMKSGGHSAFAGSNGVRDGITIDFGYLNETTYDEASKIASIGPGSNWAMAFDVLDPYGVASVGGRASVVGVGGFTTGGGYSFHSGTHGFACDSVQNFEVVLADGSVVNANPDEHADLFKALKGGSGNFGFVTRVDQRVVDSNMMWGGFVSYDLSKRDAVFSAYLNFAENMSEDKASHNIVALYYDETGYSLRSILTNVDAKPAPPAFDEYLAIANTSSTVRVGTVAELVPEFTGPTPLGLYAEWMAGMTTNDARVLEFIDEKHKEYSEKMQAAAPDSNFNVLVQFQPITDAIVSHANENGGNVLGLEEVIADGPTLMWLIAVTADNAENQKKIHPLSLEFRDAVNEYATEIGANKNWDYLNYAYGDQDPIASYGPTSVKALKDAAKKYDPKDVFQRLRVSGFKLPS